MNKELKEILLDIFRREEKAAQVQESRGGYDIGRRSAVTAGKHFDPLSEYISKELQTYGVASESIFWNEKLNIPGWFRASKQWDMLAFHQEDMIAAIEFKSIGSSYGNNINNRVEEALGSAYDTHHAVKYNLYRSEGKIPPMFAYLLVARKESASTRIVRPREMVHFPADKEFMDTSYLDRCRIFCDRLLQERVYDAVWLVYVDVEHEDVEEPLASLSYEQFMHRIKSQVELFR
ncbi:MAG: PaeR7I family type II restriction endonuclease [Selenomonas sp.]|uniref:PaeR7I family type II restriction endonuclease n=1 Tax=Selenomonas sp. TaxID=2053611 RepID=UPI0025D5A420|nr:PaeR7I family type II restriction endonuclease [Selenomonas sp.]MCI6231843.1 PaeR7I family type II restriction endonuclease [Selenomonas sp.]